MGQQQLLLLLVGIVLVALAVTGGVQAYGVNKVKSQQDDFALEALEMANEILAWQKRHPSMGGNQGNSSLGTLDLYDLGRSATSYTGSVSYLDMSDRRIIIDASSGASPIVQIHALPISNGIQSYEMAMWGEDPDCWSFRIQKYDGSNWNLISGDTANPNSGVCTW